MADQRALVVDDSKVGRVTMQRKLESLGVQVDMVESGQQALDYLKQHQPDMIFMDHMMPDLDGFETTQRIKADPTTQHIPVIIISGNDDDDFVQQARSMGALHAISKPPAPGVVEALLHTMPHKTAGAESPVAGPAAADKAKIQAMDKAAVHAYVERVLGEVVEHLHSDLAAELGKHLESSLETERHGLRAALDEGLGAGEEALRGLAGRLDGLSKSLAEFAEGKPAEAAAVDHRLGALEQRIQTLADAEPVPAPDEASLQAAMESRVAAGLDVMKDGILAQAEERFASLMEESKAPPMPDYAQRLEDMERRLASLESVEAVPGLDAEAILAAMDERMSSRLNETRDDWGGQLEARSASLRDSVEARLAESGAHAAETARRLETLETGMEDLGGLLQHLGDGRFESLAGETMAAAAGATDVDAGAETPDRKGDGLQVEMAQLRSRVHTLTLLLAVGGVVVLAILGFLYFAG